MTEVRFYNIDKLVVAELERACAWLGMIWVIRMNPASANRPLFADKMGDPQWVNELKSKGNQKWNEPLDIAFEGLSSLLKQRGVRLSDDLAVRWIDARYRIGGNNPNLLGAWLRIFPDFAMSLRQERGEEVRTAHVDII